MKRHFWLPPDALVTIETFYARLHPDDHERTRLAIERSIASHAPYDIEYRTVAPDDHPQPGEERWIRAMGYTAYNDADQPMAQAIGRAQHETRAAAVAVRKWVSIVFAIGWTKSLTCNFTNGTSCITSIPVALSEISTEPLIEIFWM